MKGRWVYEYLCWRGGMGCLGRDQRKEVLGWSLELSSSTVDPGLSYTTCPTSLRDTDTITDDLYHLRLDLDDSHLLIRSQHYTRPHFIPTRTPRWRLPRHIAGWTGPLRQHGLLVCWARQLLCIIVDGRWDGLPMQEIWVCADRASPPAVCWWRIGDGRFGFVPACLRFDVDVCWSCAGVCISRVWTDLANSRLDLDRGCRNKLCRIRGKRGHGSDLLYGLTVSTSTMMVSSPMPWFRRR